MKTTLTLIAITISIAITGCSKNNNSKTQNCEQTVSINAQLYNNTKTDNYSIVDAIINDDCLQLTFGASGCNSKAWIAQLVDAEIINGSDIPQRSIKLILTNNELCAAFFTKKTSFDLTPLRIKGSNKINLVLSGFNRTLTYNY